MFILFFFFFSSRRRHTRCGRDWSSDVCSSDLFCPPIIGEGALHCGHGPLLAGRNVWQDGQSIISNLVVFHLSDAQRRNLANQGSTAKYAGQVLLGNVGQIGYHILYINVVHCMSCAWKHGRLCQKHRNNGITGKQSSCWLTIFRLSAIPPAKLSRLKCYAGWCCVMDAIWTPTISALKPAAS